MPFVVNTFDNAVVAANPNNWDVYRLNNSHDGVPHNGLPPAFDGANPGPGDTNINTGAADATGLVLDYTYTSPIPAITSVRFFNNGGGVLVDQDGAATIDIEIFDQFNVSIFGPATLVAGDGGQGFVLDVGLLQNVSRVQVSNITATPGGNVSTVANPYIGGIWFGELETLTPDADCAGATNIDLNSATLNATIEAMADGNFYQWTWGTSPNPAEHDRKSPLISSTGSNPNSPGPDPISFPTGDTLQPGTTYFYQVCVYDGDEFTMPEDSQANNSAEVYNVNPICSEVCSFTTLDGAVWCGGFFDPNNCLFVDTPNDDYYNCNGF